jgi:hypothetical protein
MHTYITGRSFWMANFAIKRCSQPWGGRDGWGIYWWGWIEIKESIYIEMRVFWDDEKENLEKAYRHVCVCVCVCVCMCVCVFACVRMCILYICTHTHTHTHIYIYIFINIIPGPHTYCPHTKRLYTQYTYIHTHIHTYHTKRDTLRTNSTSVYIHTYIHTYHT